ncbi:MAG: TraR/DksA C4-type zinc finger protein [Acidimicrobiales bacterium]|nr:TraR/DksA C4-type zinc finger protein [Acidimicrobiales bacterium]
MATPDLTSVRASLEEERADLDTRLSELTTDGSSAPDFDENFADSAQVAAEKDENLALAATLKEQLADVTAALGRLDDGSYGRCEVCGAEIAAARLEAMPATRYCIDHA